MKHNVTNHNYFIGIDIGTSSIKTSVYDRNFNVTTEKVDEYTYENKNEAWTEIDPYIWSNLVIAQLKDIFREIPFKSIKSIGITGQMHTTVFLDKDHEPIYPAIMWNDKRTIKIVEEIKNKLPLNDETLNIHQIVSTGSPLANLLWLKENEPVIYDKLNKMVIAKDFVRYILTGQIMTDFCDASTSSMFNVIKEEWSTEVIQTFELSHSIFPEVKPATVNAGYLKLTLFDIQEDFSLPVVVGTGDNVASAVANRVEDKQVPIISLGTSGVFIVSDSKDNWKRIGKNIIAKIMSEDNTVVTQGVLQSGAKVIDWWTKKVVQQDITKIEESLEDKIGDNNIIFFPYLNGDKTLFKDPTLNGYFTGITFDNVQSDFSLAIYEGVAFAFKRIIEAMKLTTDFDSILLIGGGAQSNIWPIIFANVLNKTMLVNSEPREASCGAAMLAYFLIYQEFPELESNFKVVEPEKSIAFKYVSQYKKFMDISDMVINNERRVGHES